MSDVASAPIWEADDRNWRQHAACRGCDPDLFHPTRGQDVSDAKRICAVCPVADICLQWALENNETMGVWGGRSERERRTMRRQLRIKRNIPTNQPINHNGRRPDSERCGTETGYQWHMRHKDAGPACPACQEAHRAYARLRVAEWREKRRGDAA